MVDKRKLKELMAQEGKFKVYSEQDLIKPLSNLLVKRDYLVPIGGGGNSESNQIIFKNLIEQYFMDFLGVDESQSCVPKIMNPITGELIKDYSKEFYTQTLTVPYRSARSIFERFRDQLVGCKIFEGSSSSDFIYAGGDMSGHEFEANMRVTPMEFFAKYINTKEEKNDSEFMFIRYAAEFGSTSGFKDPNILYSYGEYRFEKPSLESNIYYSKIKYFEDGDNSFVYIENRRLSVIKKRYFTNLTVNKNYYNNLLASLAYASLIPQKSRSPLSTILSRFYDGKFWGNSYDLSFASIRALNHHSTIFNDIKEYTDEDYLIFDNLDFSYNKDGSVSKAYALTSEGMYSISRKEDGTFSLINPKEGTQPLNSLDDLIDGILLATKPAFANYKNEHGENKLKRFKSNFIESQHRKNPVNYLFSVLKSQDIGAEDAMKIKQSSIYTVLKRIYENKLAHSETFYQKPKNSSKLALNSNKDDIQILADHLASSHKEIHKDFVKNSYKVTLTKLKRAFDVVPRILRGTREDYENGLAINLGDGMYLKFIKHRAEDLMKMSQSMTWNSQGQVREKPDFAKIDVAYPEINQIKVTLSWLLVTCYDLEREDGLPKRNFREMMTDFSEYLHGLGGSSNSPINSYASAEKTTSLISFNYNNREGIYANCDEFNSLEWGDKKEIQKTVDRVCSNMHGKVIHCEPLFGPTQYKVIAKDSAGNVAYSIVRPFISVDLKVDGDITKVALNPSIPMFNFIFYAPKAKLSFLNPESSKREVFSVHLHHAKSEELIDFQETYVDPLSMNREDIDPKMYYQFMSPYQSTLSYAETAITKTLRNPISVTLRDLLTGSLSTEKHPYIKEKDYLLAPYFPNIWNKLFQREPSKFFKDYKVPDILFGTVGKKYEKLKKGDAIKNYFKGTSWEILRIDAWLGLRPADRNNLNLYNPEHWVNQRALLDYEFLIYMLSVLVGGAYQLTTFVETGMDTREINYETYDDRVYGDVAFPPHLRGPYGIAVLRQDIYSFNLQSTLSYFTGCFAAKDAFTERTISSKGFECFTEIGSHRTGGSLKASTILALMDIRDGNISTYTDFVMKSFETLLEHKTKKEKKIIRNRLHKFLMSEDYVKAVLITASQPMIESLAEGSDIGTDLLSPVESLQEEIRRINRQSDFGSTPMILLFREMFSFPLVEDDTLGYSINEIFRYIKSLIVEQRVSESINEAAHIYKNYLENLYALKKYGKIDLRNRKVAFPEALRTQADIIAYNRNLIKDQEEMDRFQKGSSPYKIMEYSDHKYTIRMAKSPLELKLEGDALRHCVGGYANSMAEGSNIIFFLRERSDPDASNVTVEFVPQTGSMSHLSSTANFNGDNLEFTVKGYIGQVQGMSRRPVNREEALFLNEWRTFVQSQMRKKINIIPTFGKRNKVKIRYEFSFGPSIQNQIDNHFASRQPVT